MPIKTEKQGRGRPAPAKGRTESQRDTSNAERRRTELRLKASRNLDRMTAIEIVRLMNREDRKVAGIVGSQLRPIAKAVDAVVEAMSRGGRLFYVGAGSSGRMAVLDAAECPPTFGIPHSQMVALIAGGRRAVTGAVEGAEDAVANGARDLRRAGAKRGDVVVGIAASGTTPYVIGAMKFARQRGAKTIVVTSNGRMPLADLADILIAPEVGPEVLTGSTRLKAGTAQKMVLNMLSTAVMTNQKLRERAVRMLVAASGADASSARHALRAARHSLRVALVMLKLGIPAGAARRRLAEARGNLRAALGE